MYHGMHQMYPENTICHVRLQVGTVDTTDDGMQARTALIFGGNLVWLLVASVKRVAAAVFVG